MTWLHVADASTAWALEAARICIIILGCAAAGWAIGFGMGYRRGTTSSAPIIGSTGSERLWQSQPSNPAGPGKSASVKKTGFDAQPINTNRLRTVRRAGAELEYSLALRPESLPGRLKRDRVEPPGRSRGVHLGEGVSMHKLRFVNGLAALLASVGLLGSDVLAAELEGALQYPPASVGADAQPLPPDKTMSQPLSPWRIELGVSGSSVPPQTQQFFIPTPDPRVWNQSSAFEWRRRRLREPGRPTPSVVWSSGLRLDRPSRRPVPPRPDPRRRVIIAHLEHPAGRLDLGPDAPTRDKGVGGGRIREVDRNRVVEHTADTRRCHRPAATMRAGERSAGRAGTGCTRSISMAIGCTHRGTVKLLTRTGLDWCGFSGEQSCRHTKSKVASGVAGLPPHSRKQQSRGVRDGISGDLSNSSHRFHEN